MMFRKEGRKSRNVQGVGFAPDAVAFPRIGEVCSGQPLKEVKEGRKEVKEVVKDVKEGRKEGRKEVKKVKDVK
jgi:hypothetical protein